jgi:hypothetical protein
MMPEDENTKNPEGLVRREFEGGRHAGRVRRLSNWSELRWIIRQHMTVVIDI